MTHATLTMDGAEYVLVPTAEYRSLTRTSRSIRSKSDASDRVDALSHTRASIAAGITRDRSAVGLSQRALAAAAGIRVEVLNRAEKGAVVPSVKTLEKIERALVNAGLKRRPVR